jgi:flavin reductase (DIM6/NTAB) family NADH-FMN oxidoreductase RutF
MEINARKLRNCLGCFTTGVAIATTITKDNIAVGLTINSFSSVSLDPPLVLFSLDRTTASFQAFCDAEHFAINILTEQQIELSRKFALSHPGKWTDIPYSLAEHSGCPVLEDSMAYFECRKEYSYEGGDHLIFVGHVLRCEILSEDPEVTPLLYARGMYRSIGKKL